MTRWARAVGVAAVCGATLAGCSIVPTLSDLGRTGPRFHLAQIGGGPTAEDRTLRVRHASAPPGNEYEWTVASVDPTSRQVRMSYIDGACTTADRVDLEETPTTIVVGISASKSFHGNCIAVGIRRTTTITLRTPLGGRALMEAVTGTNDGLPTVSDPTSLPDPNCGSASVFDVPVGMHDATSRMAPNRATSIFVCRTWWPNGRARTESTTITDPAAATALTRSLDAGAEDVRPRGASSVPCTTRLRGSRYDVYVEGPGMQVEVRTDEINCMTITNGAISGRLTPMLAKRLDALFPA